MILPGSLVPLVIRGISLASRDLEQEGHVTLLAFFK